MRTRDPTLPDPRIHINAACYVVDQYHGFPVDNAACADRNAVGGKCAYTQHPKTRVAGSIHVGRRCFIGGSTLMPGVTIGDESIVAAGAVVMSDVPPRCIVGSNPARIIRCDIEAASASYAAPTNAHANCGSRSSGARGRSRCAGAKCSTVRVCRGLPWALLPRLRHYSAQIACFPSCHSVFAQNVG